jgi:AraC family transcriptional regulator
VTGPFQRVQPALSVAVSRLDGDVSLATLAAEAGLSPFHLHRLFVDVAGETPKAYTQRLRLSRAGVLLLTSGQSVLEIALGCGFQSHEVFARAFRKRFGMTPTDCRARGFTVFVDQAAARSHARAVSRAAPCLRLFHMPLTGHMIGTDMTYDIVQKDLDAQAVLLVRRRVTRAEIGSAIGEALPHIFMYAQKHGIALAGHPLTRYVEVGAGLLTIEPAMRVVSGRGSDNTTAAEDEVVEGVLPAGSAATTIHAGPYETLTAAYAALERWMEQNGLRPAGPPWEDYITDPAEFPDPKDWKTEVCWPVARKM